MSNQIIQITVETNINLAAEDVWKLWTTPADIMQWNNPTEEWHTPNVETDLKDGGSFLYRMETKDGSMGFDHYGKYDKIITNELIEYTVAGGRKSIITFMPGEGKTRVTETFEPETQPPLKCKEILFNQY